MFFKSSILNSLMKQAYKGGLVVAQSEDEWIYLAGDYWEVGIKREFIPKRTLADIIALVGEIPEPGERFRATKEGNQFEMEMRLEVQEEGFGSDTLTITDVLLIGTAGTVQRLLQDENTGNIYAVNNVFVNIVDNKAIEEDKGEYGVTEPFFSEDLGILWKNDVCKLRATFRSDDKNTKVLQGLHGVDITPGIPE
jgi:hypothetical protein